jgi:EF-hand domain-containing family member B
VSDHVDTVIKSQNLNGLADKFNDTLEGQYESNKREPLGTSYTRKYDWPAAAENGRTTFGLPTKDIINAKDILYPAGGATEERFEHAQMYKRTHSNYYPGEQRVREYDWQTNPSINGKPESYSFGFGE